MEEPTLEQKLELNAKAALITRGDVDALRIAVAAIMASHPDRAALLAALRHEAAHLYRHWDNFPDQGHCRFRTEELLEDWVTKLQTT